MVVVILPHLFSDVPHPMHPVALILTNGRPGLAALHTVYPQVKASFEMAESEFCYAQGWHRRLHRRESPGSATPRMETGSVPKVFQKGI